jgi:putative ABC transport system permease protein
VKRSERLYRWLLRLYPRDFRDEYGQEMSLLFRARAADGPARLWLQVLGDLVFHAPREHWSATKQDLRYALRQLRRSPAFSAVVISTLALGIGGTTAVATVAHAVLLAPLPYAQAGQLVRLYQEEPGNPATRGGVSAPHFRTLRDQTASFADVGARYFREDLGLDLSKDGDGQRLRTLLVTSDYFRTLRAAPFIGPGFQPDDEAGEPGNDRTGARRVVLSDAVWRARFNADQSIVGTFIRLSAEPFEVAGIAPAGFEDPVVGAVDAWVPYNLTRDTITENYSLTVVGRLRAGTSVTQALAELAVLSQSMKERWPEVKASSIVAVPLQADVVAPSRNLLQLLLVAVGLVLLVACVNVANLMLVRATGRAPEFAIRTALGSGRGRLARQLLVEALVLAGFGGVAGLALATIGVSVLKRLGRDALPRIDSIGFDPLVLVFAVVVTVATALACGVMPALRLARTDPSRALARQSRSATGSRWQGRLRTGLAAAQLALALALLTGAGVLSASFYQLMNIDLGFRVDGVLTFDVNLPGVRYGAERRAAFQEDLARQLAAIPGVIAAGGTSRLPATGSFHPWPLHIDTGPLAGTRVPEPPEPQHRTVSGEFFKALSMPVLAGRTFDDRDDASAPMRAVVSADLARIAFPGMPLESVVGQRIAVLGRKNRREIIGVVGDVKIDVYGKPSAAVYSAHRQFAGNRNWMLTHVVATNGPAESIIPAIRAVVAGMDPELVVHRAAAMADVVGRGTSRERFALVLMGAFAGVALTLAAIGLYGVLAYVVRQRTPEIGIRIALGATAAHIRLSILRQAGLALGAGLVAGTAGALVLGRWLTTLAFGISPSDPRIVVAAAALLTLTGLIAAWLPARRAARVEPRDAMNEVTT